MTAALRHLILERFRWIDGHADVAGLLRDSEILSALGSGLLDLFENEQIDAVAAPEARGFILGTLVAQELGCGLILIRKPGSVHPGPCLESKSAKDWRGNQPKFRLRKNDIEPGARVLLVDDWVETGSQAMTCKSLIEEAGGFAVGMVTLVQDCNHEIARELNLRTVVCVDDL